MHLNTPPRLPPASAAQALFAAPGALAAEQPLGRAPRPAAVLPQGGAPGCCGNGDPFLSVADLGTPVYAWGTVEATFPSLSVEKEFFQAIEPGDDGAAFDPKDTLDLWRLNEIARSSAVVYKVLSRTSAGGLSLASRKLNLYIAREMCWSLVDPDGTRLWSIRPRNDQEVARLVAALEPDQNAHKQPQILIGRRSPIPANPQCGDDGVVAFNRLYPRTAPAIVAELLATYPDLDAHLVQPLVDDLLALAPGAGGSGEERALNYLLLNQLDLYYQTYQRRCNARAPNASGYDLNALQPVAHRGGDGRERVDAVLAFQGNDTGALGRWYYRVDVQGEFPYLLQGWKRYVLS